MLEKLSKSGLAIRLSALKGFPEAKVSAEQYITEPEIAADILWKAFMMGDIKGRTIADFGAGTGILGIGALLLGAKKVIFIDFDQSAILIAKQNLDILRSEGLASGKAVFMVKDIKDVDLLVDIVIENPPFGTKIKHSDRLFLENAFKTAPVIYSLHKSGSHGFIEAFSMDNGFKATHCWRYSFPLKQTMKFHRRRIQRIDANCFRIARMEKNINNP